MALVGGLYTITASPWDHVGLIWMSPSGEPWVIDSGSFRYFSEMGLSRRPLDFGDVPTPDPAWKLDASGPQMYNLAKFIEAQKQRPLETRPGKITWWYEALGVRQLREPLTEPQLTRLRLSVESMACVPYQQKDGEAAGEMMRAAIDLCDCCGCTANVAESRDSVFCSEVRQRCRSCVLPRALLTHSMHGTRRTHIAVRVWRTD